MPLTDKTGIVTNKMRKNAVNDSISALASVLSWSIHEFSSRTARHNGTLATRVERGGYVCHYVYENKAC